MIKFWPVGVGKSDVQFVGYDVLGGKGSSIFPLLHFRRLECGPGRYGVESSISHIGKGFKIKGICLPDKAEPPCLPRTA